MVEGASPSQTSSPMPVDQRIHPWPDLLAMTPDAVVQRYRDLQHKDFLAFFDSLSRRGTLPLAGLPGLTQLADGPLGKRLGRRLDRERLQTLFEALHRHVLGHPVWVHPFFRRFFQGPLTLTQIESFLRQYLNQIKNTRQCVALALGRLHGLALPGPDPLYQRMSELTETVLASLLADEYGVSAHETDLPEEADAVYFSDDLFEAQSHIDLYRRLFALTETLPADQDEPMLPGTADNVLAQRLLAADGRFGLDEALGSVGMAMEWGVPVFFSLLLGGLIRFQHQKGAAVDPAVLAVLTGHVRQDVEHAVGTMMVAALWVEDGPESIDRLRSVTNILMATRYRMMNDLHALVFAEPCPTLTESSLDPVYRIADRRIEEALAAARRQVDPVLVTRPDYADLPIDLPFAN